MDRIVIRRARHGDCDPIKGINRNIYNGLDYFLSTFHKEVATQSDFPFVAEIDSKVVGYTSGKVINDGMAISMATARVAEHLQGNTVVSRLSTGLLKAAVDQCPHLKEILWTTNDREEVEKSMKKHPFIKILDERPTVAVEVTMSALKNKCKSKQFGDFSQKYEVDKIVEVPKQEALRLMTEKLRFKNFTRGPFFMMRNQPGDWALSTLQEQLTTTRLYVSRCPQTREVLAFSLCTLHTIEAGLRCWLEFYSPVDGSHSELVIPHMLYHLRELAITEHSDPQVILTYTMPVYIGNREQLKAVVNDPLGLSPGRIGEKPMILLGCSLSDIFAQSSKL